MDRRLDEVLRILHPPAGEKLWYGGASPFGSLRGVNADTAARKPEPSRHSIWELALHIAYWEYAVRRILDELPAGSFPRSPADWPAVPDVRSERSWKEDRTLLRREHEAVTDAVARFDSKRVDEIARGSGSHRYIDLMYGVIMHNTYHAGQIQLAKRLLAEGRAGCPGWMQSQRETPGGAKE